MASIVLGTIGSALGGAAAGTVGAAIGAGLGRYIGAGLDNAVFGSGALPSIEGPRLPDLAVQTSTYGKMIPLVYGMVRMSGNIIWSRPIREKVTRTTSSAGGGKGGGGGATQTTTSYSYSVSMAIAICEGEIDSVLRIWADAKQVDMKKAHIASIKARRISCRMRLSRVSRGGEYACLSRAGLYRGRGFSAGGIWQPYPELHV